MTHRTRHPSTVTLGLDPRVHGGAWCPASAMDPGTRSQARLAGMTTEVSQRIVPPQNVDFGSSSLIGTTSSPALICCPRASILALVSAEIRSEEHTSELQSLLRISYAVFCLKKKHTMNHQHN